VTKQLHPTSQFNRRQFIQSSAALSAAILGMGKTPRAKDFQCPNARPRIGVIGCGSRWGWQLANDGTYGVGIDFAKFADYLAVCDVDQNRLAAAGGLVKGGRSRFS